jgi:carbonic anhydrase
MKAHEIRLINDVRARIGYRTYRPPTDLSRGEGAGTERCVSDQQRRKPMSETNIHRRQLVRLGAGVVLAGIPGCGKGSRPTASRAPTAQRQILTMTKDWQDALTPQEIVRLAKDGNQRFVSDERHDRDYLHDQRATASGQHPAAVVLSCIDSRAPAEIILDAGIGDMFNARIAGNFVDHDIAGSMEFACQVAGAKVVIVMGHTSCGAIKGAIDRVQLGNLTALLKKLYPAVEAVKDVQGERNSKNKAFVDAVATENVRLTLEEIRRISPLLRDLEREGKISMVGAMYQVETGRVEFLA